MAEQQEEKPKATEPHPAIPAEAPDPEEDDLDELDDVLDDFAATKLDTKAPAPSSSGPGRPTSAPKASPAPPSISDEDDFEAQMRKGMADLLGNLDSNPEMQAQFEALTKEMMGAAQAAAATAEEGTTASALPSGFNTDARAKSEGSEAAASSSKPAEDTFQETIRKTMERMQNSSESAGAAAAASDTDDILAQMLKEMEKGGFDGEGSDEDFSKMLMGMMEQLTNKEVLYEPMKELNDKFPGWFEKNRENTPKGDLARYEEQQVLVREIVARFDRSGYSDTNAEDREYIVERMQKMQSAGSPPPDLVGDMNAAQEALGEIDAGCPTQ
ncbi:Pex19-domain-containing protein [Aulographum hederae CBS 113979]|uniref:Pex19-domain-containing protein n=1 Tax=Aulographum hederae CBS 113979 TaxID=1176131 RepID=A0A6G1H4N7_9PEZI|nr:Pex19-domain-containing protein [Aulographum hederae CBS 113979]